MRHPQPFFWAAEPISNVCDWFKQRFLHIPTRSKLMEAPVTGLYLMYTEPLHRTRTHSQISRANNSASSAHFQCGHTTLAHGKISRVQISHPPRSVVSLVNVSGAHGDQCPRQPPQFPVPRLYHRDSHQSRRFTEFRSIQQQQASSS